LEVQDDNAGVGLDYSRQFSHDLYRPVEVMHDINQKRAGEGFGLERKGRAVGPDSPGADRPSPKLRLVSVA
jgi:hypothetical protein